jgi:hypothetical protein
MTRSYRSARSATALVSWCCWWVPTVYSWTTMPIHRHVRGVQSLSAQPGHTNGANLVDLADVGVSATTPDHSTPHGNSNEAWIRDGVEQQSITTLFQSAVVGPAQVLVYDTTLRGKSIDTPNVSHATRTTHLTGVVGSDPSVLTHDLTPISHSCNISLTYLHFR